MKPTRSLGLAVLISGLLLVAGVIYVSYRSMEADLSLEQSSLKSAPSISKTVNNESLSSRPVPSPATPVESPPAVLEASVQQQTGNLSTVQPQTMSEEVIVEESLAPPPPPPPIPGAFAMAKLTNIPQVDQERLADIAQEFSDKVKAAGWDTTSPAYHEAWKKAAEESEEVLKAAIGVQAWQELKTRQSQED